MLGPSEDGGYCLIGLSQASRVVVANDRAATDLFTGIPWSTGRVFAASVARLESLGVSWDCTPPWYDVDDLADLIRLRDDLTDSPTAAPELLGVIQDSLRTKA